MNHILSDSFFSYYFDLLLIKFIIFNYATFYEDIDNYLVVF